MSDRAQRLLEVENLVAGGRISDAVEILEKLVNEASGMLKERLDDLSSICHLSVRKSRYQKAYESSFEIMDAIGVSRQKFLSTRLLALTLVLLFRLRLHSAIKLIIVLGRKIFQAPVDTSWVHINAILWGVYWQDLDLAMEWNFWCVCLARSEKEYLRSFGFLCYTTSLKGHTKIGIHGLKRTIDIAAARGLSDLSKDLTLWLAVSYQWSGMYDESKKIYELFENNFPSAEPFLKIISYAGRLHLCFCEAGPRDVQIALEQCFAASFALKESRNHIQIFGAKAALLALEGSLEEAQIFLDKSHKARGQNRNNLDSFVGYRFEAVTYLIGKQHEKAKVSLEQAAGFLHLFGNPQGYVLEMQRIAALIEIGLHSNYGVRYFWIGKILLKSAATLSWRRMAVSIRFCKRLLREKSPCFWSSEEMIQFFRSKNAPDNSGIRIDRTTLSLRFADALAKGTQASSTDDRLDFDAQTVIAEALPGVQKICDGKNFEECLAKFLPMAKPRQTVLFTESDDRLLVPCEQGLYIIGVQLPVLTKSKTQEFIAKAVLISGIDMGSQDIMEAGLRLILSYQIAMDSLKASRLDMERTRTNETIAGAMQMLAHDVRRPFSLLKIGLELLQNSGENRESFNALVEMIRTDVTTSLRQVNALIDDLLDSARDGREMSLVLERNEIDPRELLFTTLKQVFVGDQDLSIVFKYEWQESFLINVDSFQYLRLLSNIIDNAKQATKKSGEIWFKILAVEIDKSEVLEITIGNTGVAIQEQDLAQIFEPFFTKEKKYGTGLGLAIVKKICDAHGHRVYCRSNDRLGTEFILTLPRHSFRRLAKFNEVDFLPMASQDIMRTANQPPPTYVSVERENQVHASVLKKLNFSSRKFRIVLIEDEIIYAAAVENLIRSESGLFNKIELISIKSSAELGSFDLSHSTDLVLCDVDLGENSLDGHTLVKNFRAMGFRKPIYIHSNRYSSHDFQIATADGATGLIPKPITRFQLLSIIDEQICQVSDA